MRLLFIVLLTMIVMGATSSVAHADCYKDRKPYPTGTVINGFVCTPDGKWVKA